MYLDGTWTCSDLHPRCGPCLAKAAVRCCYDMYEFCAIIYVFELSLTAASLLLVSPFTKMTSLSYGLPHFLLSL